MSELLVGALRRFGDRPALVGTARSYTYAQAADLVARMVAVFASREYRQQTGFAMLSPNSPEVFLAQVASWIAGGRYTGLHPLGSLDDHRFVCDDADIDVLVVGTAFDERATELSERSAVNTTFTLGPSEGAGEDLLALCERVQPEPLDPGTATADDLCSLTYTGGTTGRPKAAMLPHRVWAQIVQTGLTSWQFPAGARYLACSPITHAAVLPIIPTLCTGGTVHLHESFDPQRWLDTVERERITCSFAVPTMIYALLDHGGPLTHDVSSLETVVYGGSPMVPAKLAEAQERFGQVFTQIYTQTEVAGGGTSLLRHEHDPQNAPHLLGSCGRPVMATRLQLLDDDDQPVAGGEVGEVCIQGVSVMDGYWKRPDETSEALRGGWLHTGDLARQDDDGYYYIVDRKKDMIISGGFNIFPREIEDVIAENEEIAIAAVIGVPDEKWGEAVKAVVVPRAGATVDTDTLLAQVRQRKGPHHVPKSVDVVDELPLTAVGKVDKKVLRAAYWTGAQRQVN